MGAAAPSASAPAPVPPAAAPTAAAPATSPAGDATPRVRPPNEAVLQQACDGARTRATEDPRTLTCQRWTVAWREGGTPWGFVTADSYDAVIAERERQLAFARRYARFFGVPLDERYTDPSEPICETCSDHAPEGRWGDGQKFGDAGAREAVAGAEAALAQLDDALAQHRPHLEDAARLAREPATARVARAYAKQLRHGVLDVAKARLALDNAAVFRSEPLAQQTGQALRARVDALTASHDALAAAVAKEVARAHGGTYHAEGESGPQRSGLEVHVEGTRVVATYVAAGARATWFEGTVGLDGGITGRSLVAPDHGQLTCADHKPDCGYVYIEAVLRFTERRNPDESSSSVAELWFQRAQWVMAKPFVRGAGAS